MANVNIPYADPGRASFTVLDTYLQQFLIAGEHPPLVNAIPYPLANDADFDQFSVVGVADNGDLAMATTGNSDPADDIKPIGVLAHAASLASTGEGNGEVWYSGCFNLDALVWDSSFADDALKLAAFRDSPTPTQIIVRQRYTTG